MAQLTKKKRSRSYMSPEEFFLDSHDEEKLLMFATGLLLGIGLVAMLLGIFLYGGIVIVTIALALIYIEHRAKERDSSLYGKKAR